MIEPQLVCRRWKRFGHDRLYVETDDQTRLGYWDLTTGEPVTEGDGTSDQLRAAWESWEAAGRPAGPPRTVPPAEATSAVPVVEDTPTAPDGDTVDSEAAGHIAIAADVTEASASGSLPGGFDGPHDPDAGEPPRVSAPWVDLAGNTGGEQARAQARALAAQAPVKTVFARLLGVHTPERAWRIGADGEEATARVLARLVTTDPRWRVLHAVPVGSRGADIDHVLIGPGGVFCLNTKHHPGAKVWAGGSKVLLNGHPTRYVRAAQHEAARAQRLLSAATGFQVPVASVLVMAGTHDLTVKSMPPGVHVVAQRRLATWAATLGQVADEAAVEAVFASARRSSTWTV